jgi:hypothetical protein
MALILIYIPQMQVCEFISLSLLNILVKTIRFIPYRNLYAVGSIYCYHFQANQ